MTIERRLLAFAAGSVALAVIGCAGRGRNGPGAAPAGSSETQTRAAEITAATREPEVPASPTERRIQDAVARLAPFAAVKEEPRGLVVVLPASVLFEGAGPELMDAAPARLDPVADLARTLPGHPIVVRSHETTSGDADRDRAASRQRGEAVRSYLVAHGVAAGRLRVEGVGRDEPLASHATPTGRAENRRVEIVVEGAGAAAAP